MKYQLTSIAFITLTVLISLAGSSLSFLHGRSLGNSEPFLPDSDNRDPAKTVCFLSLKPYSESSGEVRAAFDFLKEKNNMRCEYVTFADLRKHRNILLNFDIAWYHRPDTVAFGEMENDPRIIRNIRDYLENGGALLLTLDAFKYIVPLGLETVQPKDSLKSCIDEGYGRKLGFHSFRDHPVFAGLNGGAYIFAPVRDIQTRITGYFGDTKPGNGKVIAVDWDYIFLREDSKLLVEYHPGKGKVIAAGAYTWFSEPNRNKDHLELFMKNLFNYVTGATFQQKEYYWDYSSVSVTACPEKLQDTDQALVAIPEGFTWNIRQDDLMLTNRYASGNFWDVAGERILTMGSENGGIEEIWAHPFMALRDYDVGIRFDYRDTIFWLNDERPQIEVTPAAFTRTYKFPRAYLAEIIVNDPFVPAGVIHYDYKGVYGAELVVRFRSNLRLMWPYPENVLNSICHRWDEDYNAFVIMDKSGDFVTMIGGNKKPLEHIGGHFSGISHDQDKKAFTGVASDKLEMAGMMRYRFEMNDRLDMVFAATDEGNATALNYFNKAIHDPYGIYLRSDSTCREILDKSLVITTPDKDFNKGYQWALVSTNRFFVNTPGMGKALVAGYSTTRKGWDGGQKVSGRPGYGWYFGRDGQWSGFALLDYGDFDKARHELEFFRKYQDVSGKIFHEATTSGVIHYDAADATPLFVVLAGKYFRHTNDTGYLMRCWPSVKKAIDFCFSTDTDMDHLIENTNVGHGWVEGGELYGSHASLYLNACWAAALDEAWNMSLALQLPDAEGYRTETRLVRNIINTDFWNKQANFYFYGKNRDGSFRSEPTVLPAVPLSFKLADREKARNVLEQYASNAFSTNWGIRIIRDDSPLFNPRGYHYGSVWPLFTGWTAMAEYAYGNYNQGFFHIMNNLGIYKNWGLGFVEEVMNGAEYTPSGVCPHQCWSETMVLQPAIEGLLGLDVRAQENKVILAPHLPSDWDSIDARNIRIGQKSFDFKFSRVGNKYIYRFSPKQGTGTRIEFLPAFPAGTIFTKIEKNDLTVTGASYQNPVYTTFISTFTMTDEVVLEIETDKGISVLPVLETTRPGEPSAGMRIISATLTGDKYTIDLEGEPGSTGIIRIFLNNCGIGKIENGTNLGQEGNILSAGVRFEKGPDHYSRQSLIIYLEEQ